MAKLFYRLKRAYHRWCLRNAIAHHECEICVYHATTNSFTIRDKLTGCTYHAYVSFDGKIIFQRLL